MAWVASFTRGMSSFHALRLDDALFYFSQALREPDGKHQHIIYDSRAAVYEKLNMKQEAMKDTKAVIRLRPDFWQGHSRAARLKLLEKDFDLSLQFADTAIDLVKHSDAVRREELLELKELILATQRVEEERKDTRNPFEKLPLELLFQIILDVLRVNSTGLLAFLAVCRYWRNAVWNTPQLWEVLVLTPAAPDRKLSLWVARSKGFIRELYIREGVSSHVDWPFQELRDLPWDKLRRCEINSWNVAGFFEQNGLASKAFASLEVFGMVERGLRTHVLLFQLLAAAQVRSISFSQSPYMWRHISQLTSLTAINMRYCSGGPSDNPLPALRANQDLQSLVIHEDSREFLWPRCNEAIPLLHLEHLELWGGWSSRPLTCLTTPQLGFLSIKGSRRLLDRGLSALVAPYSLSKLTQLFLDSSPVSSTALILLLNHIPALERLELTSIPEGVNAAMEALASSPSSNAESRMQHIMCPSLTHINVSFCQDILVGPLVQLVKARLPVEHDNSHALAQAKTQKRCARILDLKLDRCQRIDRHWLPWLRKRVPQISCRLDGKTPVAWR